MIRWDIRQEMNISAKKDAVIAVGLSDFVAGTDTSFREVFERADELMYKRKKELKEIKT